MSCFAARWGDAARVSVVLTASEEHARAVLAEQPAAARPGGADACQVRSRPVLASLRGHPAPRR